MSNRQLGRDSKVWDPGARILIYSENNNNNSVSGLSPSSGRPNACVNYNAKEKNRCFIQQSGKPVSKRASPNKSQDSGFSDSGESESSSSSDGNKGEEKHLLYTYRAIFDKASFTTSGHVTKVYFYSNNSESHYQWPNSLPVYSSVTKINTANGTGNSSGHKRGHTHNFTVQDTGTGAREASNKSKSSSTYMKSSFRKIRIRPYICY